MILIKIRMHVHTFVLLKMAEDLTGLLVRKPKAVSVVWDYFGLKTNEAA